MPVFNLKTNLPTLFGMGEAFELVPENIGDLTPLDPGASAAPLLASTVDMNGDSLPDLILGAPGDDDKDVDAGRVFVLVTPPGGGTTTNYGAATGQVIIDGVFAGDRAGAAVGGIADLNGDGRGDILIGAPGSEIGAATDAGAAYVIWGKASGGVDLGDPFAGDGKGFVIKGQAAGDAAGTTIQSIADLNGDGKADILVGAPGQDADGADAGAVYVVFGKSTSSIINLANVATGTGGFRIAGDSAGDMAGSAIGTVGDLNGDGKAEILIGTTASQLGGADSGAVYVLFGKASTTAVDLTTVAAGTGGFVIRGVSGDMAGASVSGIGDVNGDGLADILVAAPGSDSAYVVFGKASTSAVDLADVRSGIGGFRILAEQPGDLIGMSVTGGQDLNHDGIADIVIGAPHESEGGYDAGAVYVIWGGGNASIDLTAISASMGGAKIVGDAGSLLGTTVALTGDLNGDGTTDLMLGTSSSAQSQWVINASADWQPDNNVYGTEGDDVIGAGYGSGAHVVGESDDNVIALGGNDAISTGGGNDTIDGGAGADAMDGGAGDDTYYVESGADTVIELAAGGMDAVIASSDYELGDNVENLVLVGYGMTGTGNDSANHITGTAGADVIDGAGGADTLEGGFGNDLFVIDDGGDVVVEAAFGGSDTVLTALSGYVLTDNVENLAMAGMGQAGTGNALANTITGTDGNDTLDGAGGNDVLSGGLGDDAYVVDSALDQIIEGASAGIDSVTTSVDYVLGAGVENLALTGAARRATGNALANSLTGSTGNDTLDGAAGADTMAGGLGNDIYRVDNAGDVVTELAGEGADTIEASQDYILGDGTSVENLTLIGAAHAATGNSGDNVLTGGTGADTLDGGAGIDTLVGGAGNDTYRVDSTMDVIVEQASGGTDTVLSLIDFALVNGSNVENLTLTGGAHHATGNDGDNVLTGGAGADTLEGGLGNDTLNGGTGQDTMIGGDGNDTYYVDDTTDIVIETISGGTDTVIVGSDWTLADNIENVTLSGAGHTLIGNAANNTLKGDTGADRLDGGDGDDTLEGGDGDDVLVCDSGHDTLAGGAGDDVYEIHGGSVHIEDFQGHDTIDASEAEGDCHIDLSGETVTEIEDQTCDFGTGGTVTGALNVQFLQDLTGSFTDDIANVRILIPQIITTLNTVSGGAAFGVSSFRDKAYGSFGSFGDKVYETNLAIGATATTLSNTYNSFSASGGNDEPESQIEALMQLALRSTTEVGFQSNSARIVVLFTDAHFHTAADGLAAGILTPNNGNAVINDGGILENYPEFGLVKSALEANNIIPIFAVTAGLESSYQGLATSLGRGTVVTITSSSSNIVSAISAGLTTATTTHIAAAIGGGGNDTLIGNVGENELTGGDGDDVLTGGASDDDLHGGTGEDRAVYTGAISDYTITENADGTVTIADSRGGAEGTDTLDGIELLSIGGTLYTIGGVAIAAPTAVDDAVTGVVEAGNGTSGNASAAGNVLANDSAPSGGAAVSGIHAGATGTYTAISGATVIEGTYGTVTISADGSYSYQLDNARAATDALVSGDAVTDVFTYQLTDSLGAVAKAQISVAISGTDDGIPTIVTTAADRVLVTSGIASALDAGALLANDTVTNGETLNVTAISSVIGGTVHLVDGKLVITAGGAAGFDYVATSTSGASATGRVTVATVATTAGADSVAASAVYNGADLVGQDGNDVLTGNEGIDRLVGGLGNDRLNGGAGGDTLIGGAGNDTYTVDNVADVVTEGVGEGTDIVTASVSHILGANVEKLTLSGVGNINGTGNDLVNTLTGNAGANSLVGLGGNDTLTGNAGDDILDGGDGDDGLSGGDGLDTLLGGAGNDRVNGGLGADSMIGGVGNDSYTVDDIGDAVTEALDEGIDTVTATESYALGANIEKLTLSGIGNIDGTGNDLVNTLTGNSGANSLSGFGGNDTLSGNAGDDALDGGDGDDGLSGGDGLDTLIGGAGNDRLNGGLGADTMIGGIGNDTYTVDDAGDAVTEALDEGIDAVTASVEFALGANIEKLTLSGAIDIDGVGNDLANTLTGNAGANSLHGLDGNDNLSGGLGNDNLFGDAGKDTLSGGDGDDMLSGGAGADTLTGGIGADSFSFDVIEAAANKDRIKDFQSGTDHLLIDHTVFTAFASHDLGTLNLGDISFGTAATTGDQHLVYNQASGALYYDEDGVGGVAQIQIATLANLAVMGHTDFVLI